MNKFIKISIAFILTFVSLSSSIAQRSDSLFIFPTYTLTVKNLQVTQPNRIEFDIYMRQTNGNVTPFIYGTAQYFWNFNSGIVFPGDTLRFSIVSSDLPVEYRPINPSVTGNILRIAPNLPTNAELSPRIDTAAPGTLIAKMRLSTTGTSFQVVPLNLSWRSALPNPFTKIAAYTGEDNFFLYEIQDSASHFIDPPGSLQPLANFTSDVTIINAGGSVNFLNTSANNPTSYNWSFPGGNPSVSTDANPTNIVYNTPGVYHVSLRVSNSFGSDSISKTNYITVNQSPCTPNWSNYLHISDAGNIIDSVKFGTSPTATLNIDTCFGETPLPPLPPTGSYDIRFILQNPPNYDMSKIDIRPEPANDIFWKVKFQPSGSGYPITFSWNRNDFPSSGLFFLKDEITGTLVNVDMKAQSSYVLPANLSGVTSLKIVYQYNLISDVSVTSGWNLLSVPLKAADMKFTTLFPYATSLAYYFNGIGYLNSDSAKVSKGYWLKFGRDTTYRVVGVSLTPKTIPVISGWNMIGPFDENIPVSSITSTPSGIVTSLYYHYLNGYYSEETLKVGRGYWIKTSAEGILGYNVSEKIISENINQSDSLNNFTKFTITDNNGSISNLYLANASQITGNYDLPPVPPTGIFDVRFGSDKLVESYGQNNIINLNSASYPVKLKAQNLNGHSFRIKDNISGSIVNILISDETEIEITSALDNLLLIDENLIPESYSLGQNYPNPFNPSTKIKYQLPVDGNVKIIIFDMLGKEIQTLVNGFEKAGSYELTFNAINLASGIYFYKMQSENFSEIKRMILIK